MQFPSLIPTPTPPFSLIHSQNIPRTIRQTAHNRQCQNSNKIWGEIKRKRKQKTRVMEGVTSLLTLYVSCQSVPMGKPPWHVLVVTDVKRGKQPPLSPFLPPSFLPPILQHTHYIGGNTCALFVALSTTPPQCQRGHHMVVMIASILWPIRVWLIYLGFSMPKIFFLLSEIESTCYVLKRQISINKTTSYICPINIWEHSIWYIHVVYQRLYEGTIFKNLNQSKSLPSVSWINILQHRNSMQII